MHIYMTLIVPLHNALMLFTCAPFIFTFVSIDLGGAPDPLTEWLSSGSGIHNYMSIINRAICYHVIIREFPSITSAIIEFKTRICISYTTVKCYN